MFEDGSTVTVNSHEEIKQAMKDNCGRGSDNDGTDEEGGTRG